MRANPLLDTAFLDKLFLYRNREVFIRVVALNTQEESVEEIQGRAQAGSTLNIDGNSSMRRSCTLTLVAEELNIHEYYWGLQTKFKLYVGLANVIDSRYDDIIWFPQGMFLITKFNTSQSTSSYTVQIQGKDKMALLNGDISGVITALSVDFGTIDYIADDGTVENRKLPLKEVIKEAVHEYAKEPYHNIIINDMDDLAVELLSYRGDTPLYMYFGEDDMAFDATLNADALVYKVIKDDKGFDALAAEGIKVSDESIVYNHLNHLGDVGITDPPTVFGYKEGTDEKIHRFTIAKFETGESVGYRPTDLVFAGDLISQVGSTVTSMLDKIKQMLGQYEYFYNIEGQFVFQRKKNFKMKSWLPEIVDKLNDDVYIENAAYASASAYSFQDGYLVTQLANNPEFSNIKNDFTVWGKKKTINGAEMPIHIRYAIDKRPYEYTTVNVTQKEADDYQRIFEFPDPIPAQKSVRYISDFWSKDFLANREAIREEQRDTTEYKIVDWREVLYRMALDYRKWMHIDGFNAKVEHANKARNDSHQLYVGYARGYTNYELYYTDLEGFWRTLYDPAAMDSTDKVVTNEPYIRQYISEYQFNKSKQEALKRVNSENGQTYYEYYAIVPCDEFELYDSIGVHEGTVEYVTQSQDKLSYLPVSGDGVQTGLQFNPTEQDFSDLLEKVEGESGDSANDVAAEDTNDMFVLKSIGKSNVDDFKEGTEYYRKTGSDFLRVTLTLESLSNVSSSTHYYYFEKLGKTQAYDFAQRYYRKEKGKYKILAMRNITFSSIANNGKLKNEYSEKYDEVPERNLLTITNASDYFKKVPYSGQKDVTVIDSSGSKVTDMSTVMNRAVSLFTIVPIAEGNAAYDWYLNKLEENQSTYLAAVDRAKKEHGTNSTAYQTAIQKAKDDKDTSDFQDLQVYKDFLANYSFKYQKIVDRFSDDGAYAESTDDNIEYFTKDINGVFSRKDFVAVEKQGEEKVSQFNHVGRNILNPENLYIARQVKFGDRYRSDLIYYVQNNFSDYDKTGWLKERIDNPQSLVFWFDFLDTDGELLKYSVPRIGSRPKAENVDAVKAIYYKEIPNVIFANSAEEIARERKYRNGYNYILLGDKLTESLFSMSTQGLSAMDQLGSMLYENTNAAEQCQISAMPVYTLQPNTRLTLYDKNSNIDGEYDILRISLPLNYTGLMTITAAKAIENIL